MAGLMPRPNMPPRQREPGWHAHTRMLDPVRTTTGQRDGWEAEEGIGGMSGLVDGALLSATA